MGKGREVNIITSEITQISQKGAEGHAYAYVCVSHLFHKENGIRSRKKNKMRGRLGLARWIINAVIIEQPGLEGTIKII